MKNNKCLKYQKINKKNEMKGTERGNAVFTLPHSVKAVMTRSDSLGTRK